MRRAGGLLATVVVALTWTNAAISAASPTESSQAFADGSREFQSGDYSEALAHFQFARDAGIEGPAVWYNIGVCQYRLGHYAEAEFTFRSMIDRFPEMAPLAEYNAGLSLVRQDRLQEAKRAFERAEQSGDATVVRLARAMLDRLAPSDSGSLSAEASGGWAGFVDFSMGYDDNVALLDDAAVPSGASTGSAFGQFFAQFVSPAKSEGGLHFGASAYAVRYPDAGQFDQNVLRLAGSWRWLWQGWRLEAGPHYSYSSLDGEGFERRIGGTLSMSRSLGRQASTVVRLTHEDVSELESQFGFVDGSRQMVEFGWNLHRGQGRLALGYELTVDDRAAESVSPTRNKFLAGYRYRIGDLWSVEASASYRASRYDDLNLPRTEDRAEAALTFTRELPGNWQLTGQYRFSHNDSNVDDFRYDRNKIGIGFNRVFQ